MTVLKYFDGCISYGKMEKTLLYMPWMLSNNILSPLIGGKTSILFG